HDGRAQRQEVHPRLRDREHGGPQARGVRPDADVQGAHHEDGEGRVERGRKGLTMAVEAEATARGVRTSAQKAGLVCDLIRGKTVNQALATLQFTRKTIARELAKVLRSAVANVQQKDGFGGDIDRLYVSACYANQGPSMKRV